MWVKVGNSLAILVRVQSQSGLFELLERGGGRKEEGGGGRGERGGERGEGGEGGGDGGMNLKL